MRWPTSARRAEKIARRAEEFAWARSQWEAGGVVPYYLTSAMDRKGLSGPSVDIDCGAAEPAVNEWEAGTRYPTWEQLLKAATLCEVSPAALVRRPTDPEMAARFPTPPTVYLGRCASHQRPCIMEFTEDAVAAVVGAERR
ncbi:hypothetical protein [Rhodococcus qingshengii]|uniref:hypothetical protein n=1 Tax=Rhodococcus qingshengii TaxID=334542 RepID=UPI0021B11CC3|nr:hypothetical protein [Rhodococcus qingshengii]MCT6735496.1 hypothetical protein [Rhodococcus qingshengii]